jgi:hypothetical protein
MKYKTIEKASKLYEKIKKLDKEIIELDKMASLFAENEESGVELSMKYTGKKEDVENCEREIIGESMVGSIMYIGGGSITFDVNKKTNGKETYNAELSNSAALQILGVMLGDKMATRKTLIDRIEKMFV